MCQNTLHLQKEDKSSNMKVISTFILSFFLSVALYSQAYNGKVISILDGDTVIVIENGNQTKLRLAEIDCPEKGQPFGNNAKSFTAEKIFGKIITYVVTDTDRYGRLIATIYYGEGKNNLNEELVKNGLAWHYKRYSASRRLSQLEYRAKLNKVGLWADKNPIEPAQWRKNKKTGFNGHRNYSIRINSPTKSIKRGYGHYTKSIEIK